MESTGITSVRSFEDFSFDRVSSARRRGYGNSGAGMVSRASGKDTVTLSEQALALLQKETTGQSAETAAAVASDETAKDDGKHFIENVHLKVFRVSIQTSPDYGDWVEQLENGNPAQFLAALTNLTGGTMTAGQTAAALAKAGDDELTEIAKALGAFTGIEDDTLLEQLKQIRALGLETIGTDDASLLEMAKHLGTSMEIDPDGLYDFLSELRGELESWNADSAEPGLS